MNCELESNDVKVPCPASTKIHKLLQGHRNKEHCYKFLQMKKNISKHILCSDQGLLHWNRRNPQMFFISSSLIGKEMWFANVAGNHLIHPSLVMLRRKIWHKSQVPNQTIRNLSIWAANKQAITSAPFNYIEKRCHSSWPFSDESDQAGSRSTLWGHVSEKVGNHDITPFFITVHLCHFCWRGSRCQPELITTRLSLPTFCAVDYVTGPYPKYICCTCQWWMQNPCATLAMGPAFHRLSIRPTGNARGIKPSVHIVLSRRDVLQIVCTVVPFVTILVVYLSVHWRRWISKKCCSNQAVHSFELTSEVPAQSGGQVAVFFKVSKRNPSI